MQLEESLGCKGDVHRVKVVMFPSIRMDFSQVAIHDPHSDQVMVSAKWIDLVLRFLPLLKKTSRGQAIAGGGLREPALAETAGRIFGA